MAGVEIATAYVQIVPTVRGIQGEVTKALSGVPDTARRTGETAGKSLSQGLSNQIKGIATTIGAAFAGKEIFNFFKDSARAASDLEQSAGAVTAVFKDNSSAIETFGKTSATSVGLATSQYQNMAVVFGASLKNMGVAQKDVAPLTNKLITLGADLAAQYGGDTSTAVESISSLLRGERDPIEKYGVSMKQADIEAQKMAMGLGGLTGAADKQATTQATLALLFKQTSDAQGAFGRETDTLAHKQQVLSAQFEDTKAKVGAALMPAMSGLMDIGSKLIPVVEGVGKAVGGATAFVSKLPGPVLLSGVALTALFAFKDKFASWGSTLGNALKTFTEGAKGMGSSIGAANGPMGKFGAAARSAGSAARTAGSSLLSAFGGGPMLAVTAAITVATIVIGKMIEAKRRAKEMDDQAKSSMKEYAAALADSNGAIDTNVRKAALAQLQQREWGKSSSDLTAITERFNVSLRDLVSATTGDAEAQQRVKKAMDDKILSIMKSGQVGTEDARISAELRDSYNKLIPEISKAGEYNKQVAAATAESSAAKVADAAAADSQAKYLAQATQAGKTQAEQQAATGAEMVRLAAAYQVTGKAQAEQMRAQENAAKQMSAQQKAADEAARGIVHLSDAQLKQAESSGKLVTENTTLSKTLATVGDTSKAASRDLEGFGAVIDQLTGRHKNEEEAAASWNKTLLDSADAAKEAAKEGGLNRKALTDWNVAGLTATKTGQSVYDVFNKQSEGYKSNVAAAYSAKAATGNLTGANQAARQAADATYKSFMTSTKGFGLNASQSAMLAGKLGILQGVKLTDKTLKVLGDDRNAQAKMQNVRQATINGKTVFIDGNTHKVYDSMAAVQRARTPTKTVNVDGNTDPYLHDINHLPNPPGKTVPVSADPSEYNATLARLRAAGAATFAQAAKNFKGHKGGATPDYGPATTDWMPYLLHRGEHILDAGDVAAMGGQQAVYQFRAALHGDSGGAPVPAQTASRAIGAAPVQMTVYQLPGQTASQLAHEINRIIRFETVSG